VARKLLYIFFFLFVTYTYSQKTGKRYRIDRYESIYLPLGKISFADSVVAFKLGSPKPLPQFRDSLQSLHEPNYENYQTPNFTSIGCEGSLTLAFTDNGFMNLTGEDLYIFEVGPSREPAHVEISEDLNTWIDVGTIAGGKSSIELSDFNIDPNIVFYFVRITDLKGLCRSKTAGADIDAVAAINCVLKLTLSADVLFDVADYKLKESAMETLRELTNTIQQVDNATLLIEGHTDSDGEDDYNMRLSENRCYTVTDRIQALLGYDALYEYEVKPYGERKPRFENNSIENKKMNRRVEITVLPPKDYFEGLDKDDKK